MSSPAIGVRRQFIPQTAKVDLAHPLSAGLVFCFIPSIAKDLVNGLQMGNAGIVVEGFGNTGYGFTIKMSFSNASTTNQAYTSGPFSVGVACKRPNASTYPIAFSRGRWDGNLNTSGWSIQHFPTSTAWSFNVGRGDSNYSLGANVTFAVGTDTVVGTSNGVNQRRIYVNGRLMNSGTNNINPLTTPNGVSIGRGEAFEPGGASVDSAICCSWNRLLSQNEVAMFATDPFCLLSY